jgi:ribose transport system permease protein
VLKGNLFFTTSNFINIATDVAIGVIISGGLTIPMVANEFDLSVGYLASFAGVFVTGLMYKNGLSLGVAILVTLVMSALVGLANGVIMTRTNVMSFVTTLGTGTIIVGLDYGYSNGQTFSLGLPQSFFKLNTTTFLGIPLPVYIAAAVAVILWIALNRTIFGYYLQAIGQNADAARLAGVRVDRVRVLAMMISSICAGLGGILLSSELGSGQVAIADGYLLSAFAAAFLGSVCLRDGEFHIVGTVVGVVTVGVAFNGLALMGYATFWQYAVQGGLLIGAVGVSTMGRRVLAAR